MYRPHKHSRTLSRRVRRFFRVRAYELGGQLFLSSPWPRRLTLRHWGLVPFKDRKRHGARIFSTPLAWLSGVSPRPSQVGAITVREPFGRMGNQTIQLVHAVAFASRWGVRNLYLPGNSILPAPATVLGEIKVSCDPSIIRSVPVSRFLALLFSPGAPAQHLVTNSYFSRELATPLSDKEYVEAFDAVSEVAPLALNSTPLPEDHLVIHLRGGDAFGFHAHVDYAQPPLSFYDLVLDHRTWSRVTVVKADDSHPLEAKIVEKIRRREIPVEFQSASAEQDAEFLGRASSLVSSRGSFIPAIVGRSPHTASLYLFGNERRLRGRLAIFRVTDESGDFWERCCQRNWRDTPEQRQLMESYPASNLRLAEERR